MSMSFELLLVALVFLTGMIYLSDVTYLKKHRQGTMPKTIEYSRSFFPVLLIVLILRSFLVEPFRIPTSSLVPTLLPGDFIASNKFAYGLRLPVLHTKIIKIGEPVNGDIVVLRWPVDPSVNFIKRVIGIPGDKISYINKVLYINGIEQSQIDVGPSNDSDENGNSWPVEIHSEKLNGITHLIYLRNDLPAKDFTLVVPEGNFFVMGDNRDNSADSRVWGFVPEANLIGKAFLIWFSWDSEKNAIRWNRMGTFINKEKVSE